MQTPCWLLVVDETVARDLAKNEWHRVKLARSADARPAPGARLSIVRTHRPDFVARAVALGTAEVREDAGEAILIRHRVVSPAGHEPSLAQLRLRIAAGWTDARLGELVGAAIPLPAADLERIEAAVREQALAHGPAPSRPAHRMPRTPGRRALASARVMARKAYGLR